MSIKQTIFAVFFCSLVTSFVIAQEYSFVKGQRAEQDVIRDGQSKALMPCFLF